MFWTEKWFIKNQKPINQDIDRRLNALEDKCKELEVHYTSLHNRLNKIVDYIETTLTESFNSQIEAIAKYVDTKFKTINTTKNKRKK